MSVEVLNPQLRFSLGGAFRWCDRLFYRGDDGGDTTDLAEVQALVTLTTAGNAKRTTASLDFNRASL